jgi:hypothetical protein
MTTLISYQLAFLIAVVAFVYTNILTQPEQLFAPLYKRLNSLFKSDERQRQGKSKHPLFMVMIHCEKCVAGQLSLWLYVCYHTHDYNAIQHVLFVAFTIFIAHTIKQLNSKLD